MESVQTKPNIRQLCEFGQSVWLDNISRSIIENGELARLIDLGVTGVTSNPTIFDKSISQSPDYDARIREFKSKGLSTFGIYDELTVADIQDAADLFLPVYKETNGGDGYVSLEVNPLLAHQAEKTIQEAKRLHKKVNRPNVLFKIPSTKDGIYAGAQLLSQGININFTLIFSLEQYKDTVSAFIQGATKFSKSGADLNKIFSVASVFVSRIDTFIDKLIDEKLKKLVSLQDKNSLEGLKGRAAVVNSQFIYSHYTENFSQKEFQKLKSKGLKKQKALWASTSTKNPDYSDIKYVTELIGKDTINTMPSSTLEAFLNHGIIRDALSKDLGQARLTVDSLRTLGIDINQICEQLLREGVTAFENSFNTLLKSIESKESSL